MAPLAEVYCSLIIRASHKPSKKKDDEDFERFAEMIRPIFLRMRLNDMLKMNPYASI